MVSEPFIKAWDKKRKASRLKVYYNGLESLVGRRQTSTKLSMLYVYINNITNTLKLATTLFVYCHQNQYQQWLLPAKWIFCQCLDRKQISALQRTGNSHSKCCQHEGRGWWEGRWVRGTRLSLKKLSDIRHSLPLLGSRTRTAKRDNWLHSHQCSAE